MRTPILAGNWKMNKTIGEALALVEQLQPLVAGVTDVTIVVCPPFTALAKVADVVRGSNLKVGAQGVFWKEAGAYTGEVSPGMLRDAGCEYVIIGHSERRGRFGRPEFSASLACVFGDNDDTVNTKAQAALGAELTPIVCCGETLSERQAGRTDEIVAGQIAAALRELTAEQVAGLVLAYEPVWAIGTGEVCADDEANRVCGVARATVARQFGAATSDAVRIQYGGSASPKNFGGLIAQGHIDGALVGGASLQADSFAAMAQAASAG